jgi:hypothetical protein
MIRNTISSPQLNKTIEAWTTNANPKTSVIEAFRKKTVKAIIIHGIQYNTNTTEQNIYPLYKNTIS